MICGFDIETMPDESVPEELRPTAPLGNAKKPELVEEKQRQWAEEGGMDKAMSLTPIFARIVCVSFGTPETTFLHEDERKVIQFAVDKMTTKEPPTIVTANGMWRGGFDIRTMLARMALLGMTDHTHEIRNNYLRRYSSFHIDLFDQPECQDRNGQPFSVEVLAKWYLGEQKPDHSGRIVEYWNGGKRDLIAAGCLWDASAELRIAQKLCLA